MNSKVLIVAGGSLFGPFPDQDTAQAWVSGQHSARTTYELYSLRDTTLGTAETAQECGTRLPSIDEATLRSRKVGSTG